MLPRSIPLIYYSEEKAQIILLRAYAKNRQANLTPQQAREVAYEVTAEKKQE